MRLTLINVTAIGLLAVSILFAQTQRTVAAEIFGLSPGPVELKSVGPIAFGPSGVLFVSDPRAAKVYAMSTEDKKLGDLIGYDNVDTAALNEALGGNVEVVDLAVNPETRNAFLSVTVDDKPALAKVDCVGKVSRVNLDKIGHAAVSLPNPPEDREVRSRRGTRNMRDQSISDIAFTEGRLLVAGLSATEAPSTVREFEFPFRESSAGMQVEIYHAAHGRSEDTAAIQTFVPFNIGGEPSVLAGYQCTPLVKIPIGKIASSDKITGTTVAELGNRNRPLDMIAYKKDGKDFLLIANSDRGVMKVSTDGLAENEGLSTKVDGGGTAGQPYDTIAALEGTIQLDKLDDDHALVMLQAEGQPLSMKVIDLP